MNVPAATFIEMAVEELKTLDQKQLEDQSRELDSALGKPATQENIYFYSLGLQTARVLLTENIGIERAGLADVV